MSIVSKTMDLIKDGSTKISDHFNDFVRHTVLPNGINLASQRRFSSRNLNFFVILKRGALEDPLGKEGVAHFLEHVLSDIKEDEEFRRRNGYISLATGGGRIRIEGSIENSSENIDFILEKLRAMLEDSVDTNNFFGERNRIQNEINIYADKAESNHRDLISESYEDRKSWENVSGSRDSFGRITIEDLNEYKKLWFRGPNIVMAFTGIKDHSVFHEKCAEKFSEISGEPTPEYYNPTFISKDFRQNPDGVHQLYFATISDIPPVTTIENQVVVGLSGAYLNLEVRRRLLNETRLVYDVGAHVLSDSKRSGMLRVLGNVLPELGCKILPEIADILAKSSFAPDQKVISEMKRQYTFSARQIRGILPFIPVSAENMAGQIASFGHFTTFMKSARSGLVPGASDVRDFIQNTVYGKSPSVIAYGNSNRLHSLDEFVSMLEEGRKKYAPTMVQVPPAP